MRVLKLILIILISFYSGKQFVQALQKCPTNFIQNYREQVKNGQDTAVPPCDDFYTFVCGNWQISNQLKNFGARDTLTKVKASNKLVLARFFETKAYANDKKELNVKRQRLIDFFNSCVDLQLNDNNNGNKNASAYIYAKELQRIASDWPILNPNFSESTANASFNWEYVSAEMRRYGANAFWRTLVQPNWQSSEQLIFYITPPTFDFIRHSKQTTRNTNGTASESEDVFAYKTYIKYLLLDLGVRIRKALKYADEIVQFEQELMALVATQENSVILTAPQTLASLSVELPNIQLQKYFNALLQDINLPKDYEKKLLIVADTVYLQKLSKLMRKTNTEVIGMYLLVQFLTHFEVNLHSEESVIARQEHCLQQANTFLPMELSSLFLDVQHDGNGKEFLQQAQQDLNEMFNNLKMQFELAINGTNVFAHNLQTRTDGLEKLRSMQLKLPQLKVNDDREGDRNVQGAFSVSGNYDVNLLNLSKMKVLHELNIVNLSIAYDEGVKESVRSNIENANEVMATNYGPLDVNAYYRLKKNAIEIPVGLLSLPIYDSCMEQSMIYGTIGYVVGHEMLHGFDYDGLNYDKSGNIANGWDAKSLIAYGTKASCYLGTRYNRAHTNINENIADGEGMRLAVNALKKKSQGQLTKEQLQLFFTSFAQIWCRESQDLNERHALHASHRERVNNVLGNFPEFAETFQCKTGTTMNPAEKCRIW